MSQPSSGSSRSSNFYIGYSVLAHPSDNTTHGLFIPNLLSSMALMESKPPTTFLSLPAELRNRMYDLSRNLEVYSCFHCTLAVTDTDIDDAIKTNNTDTWNFVAERKHNVCNSSCTNLWTKPGLELRIASPRFGVQPLWVNRSSHFAEAASQNPVKEGNSKSVRNTRIDCRRSRGIDKCTPAKHGNMCVWKVAPPDMAKVSKQVREETLSIYYGDHTFLVTLLDRDIDSETICEWLETIGERSAASLRNVKLVYRTKKDLYYIEKELMPAMHKLGMRNTDDVVELKRLRYPYCYCEGCIRRLLAEDVDTEGTEKQG